MATSHESEQSLPVDTGTGDAVDKWVRKTYGEKLETPIIYGHKLGAPTFMDLTRKLLKEHPGRVVGAAAVLVLTGIAVAGDIAEKNRTGSTTNIKHYSLISFRSSR